MNTSSGTDPIPSKEDRFLETLDQILEDRMSSEVAFEVGFNNLSYFSKCFN